MSEPHRKRRPPFVSLPRHKRSETVVRLNSRVRRTAADYGGRFTTDVLMADPASADRPSRWLDFCFAGTDRLTVWNAEIITASLAFEDAVQDQARSRAWSMLSDDEQTRQAHRDFEPASRSRTGKVLTYRMVERAPIRYPQFDGRTLNEQIDLLEAAIIRDEPPAIHEAFRLDRHYVYGIGLYIVVDAPAIDRAVVEAAMDRFVALGESDWMAADAVGRERLQIAAD